MILVFVRNAVIYVTHALKLVAACSARMVQYQLQVLIRAPVGLEWDIMEPFVLHVTHPVMIASTFILVYSVQLGSYRGPVEYAALYVQLGILLMA